MKKSVFICFLLTAIVCYNKVSAQKIYDFNATCQQAYQAILSLKINEGEKLINDARKQNPNNLIPDLLAGYIDFFVLFFNEDPAEFKARKLQFDERLQRLDDGPQNSPYYNYCRSVCYMQKATAEIKFGERWASGWDFRKAFSLIKENRKKFPNFLPNNMIYGPMETVVGVIPDGYKWMAAILGLKGSVKDGINLMQNFVNSNDATAKIFFNEAAFYYCYLLFYIGNKPDEVFRFINQKKLDVVNNHLFAYLAANLSINNKQTEYAKNIILNKNPSPEYMPTPVWDYEMAFVKLHHLEIAEATKYFQRFLQNFKGKFYVKDSYEKLSWCYYLQGNMAAAQNARQLVLKKGNTDTDADKQANDDAKAGTWPNVILLKARLLSDGGYNREALEMLYGKGTDDFSKPEEKLEFAYRIGRIYDDLGKDSNAVSAYLTAIKLGEHRNEYYASRAALQIGGIYEREGKKALAIAFYQKCLDMGDHEYKNSIDQKAKAGIARCKGE
ncbi:MAG: tetratricopeptide repeat protein [Chitinophagaceae bacterium]